MTDIAGPFDSAQWSQDQWYRHAALWAPSGVYSTTDLPLTFSGLTPTVGAGRAWVRGAGFERTAAAAMAAVPANTNASLSRRDRIVLRRDLAAKTVTPTLIQGTPASTPVAPSVQQVETGQWDLRLFSFLVPPNSGTTISGIADERQALDATTGGLAITSGALSLTSNYASAASTWGAPKWRRQGSKMNLQGSVTNAVGSGGSPYQAAAGSEYQIAGLPTAADGSLLTPADTRAFSVAFGNGTTFAAGFVIVHTDGRVNFMPSTAVSLTSPGFLSLSLSGIEWVVGV